MLTPFEVYTVHKLNALNQHLAGYSINKKLILRYDVQVCLHSFNILFIS